MLSNVSNTPVDGILMQFKAAAVPGIFQIDANSIESYLFKVTSIELINWIAVFAGKGLLSKETFQRRHFLVLRRLQNSQELIG